MEERKRIFPVLCLIQPSPSISMGKGKRRVGRSEVKGEEEK